MAQCVGDIADLLSQFDVLAVQVGVVSLQCRHLVRQVLHLPGQVTSGEFISGQVRPGEFISGQVTIGEFISGRFRSHQVNSCQVRSGQVTAGQVVSNQTLHYCNTPHYTIVTSHYTTSPPL